MSEALGRYGYSVAWSEEDQAYVARVAELPYVAAHGDTPEEALSEVQEAVVGVLEVLKADGKPAPEPISTRRFSGRFNVRVSSELHRQLVLHAAREGVSLNHLVTERLARLVRE